MYKLADLENTILTHLYLNKNRDVKKMVEEDGASGRVK